MMTISNHSIALLFLATLLFLFLFAGVVVLWCAARMNLTEGVSVLRSGINIINNEGGNESNRCQREFPRIGMEDLRADISDGIASYSSQVANISAHGLCLHGVPDKLSSSRSLLSVVVRGQEETYRIVVRPRWMHVQDNRSKTLGVEIASAPTSWTEFVSSH